MWLCKWWVLIRWLDLTSLSFDPCDRTRSTQFAGSTCLRSLGLDHSNWSSLIYPNLLRCELFAVSRSGLPVFGWPVHSCTRMLMSCPRASYPTSHTHLQKKIKKSSNTFLGCGGRMPRSFRMNFALIFLLSNFLHDGISWFWFVLVLMINDINWTPCYWSKLFLIK